MESNSRAEHSNAKHDSVWATVWWQNAAFSFCYANDTAVSVAQEGGEVARPFPKSISGGEFGLEPSEPPEHGP